jgi:hypothetical protein
VSNLRRVLMVVSAAFFVACGGPIEEEQQTEEVGVAQQALSCSTNCEKKCCFKVGGLKKCEPTCKSNCEAFKGLSCGANHCTLARVADPNYDAFKNEWQKAAKAGRIKSAEKCVELVGQAADKIREHICGLNVVCQAFVTVGQILKYGCICSEISYPASSSGGGGGGGGIPGNTTNGIPDHQT